MLEILDTSFGTEFLFYIKRSFFLPRVIWAKSRGLYNPCFCDEVPKALALLQNLLLVVNGGGIDKTQWST